MRALRISDLAKTTGVSGKTLRYWESLGLLPRAKRTHTGYRLFGPDSIRRVEFIQKAKGIGLTLKQIAKVLRMAEEGLDPCPEVVRWTGEKILAVEQQIKLLSAVRRRLELFRLETAAKLPCPPMKPSEICCVIEGLPPLAAGLGKGGQGNAKILVAAVPRVCGAGD